MKTENQYLTIPNFMILLNEIGDGNKTIMEMHKDLGITLAHLYNTKKLLILKGLIDSKTTDKKRNRVLSLTSKGKRVASAIRIILIELELNSHKIKDNLSKSRTMQKLVISDNDKEELDELVDKVFVDED